MVHRYLYAKSRNFLFDITLPDGNLIRDTYVVQVTIALLSPLIRAMKFHILTLPRHVFQSIMIDWQ